MSDVSHQVSSRPARMAREAAIASLVFASGCATGGMTERARFEPIAMFGDDAPPRITLYGSLLDLLDEPHQTSALEDFLYGPAPAPSPFLRNPQGLAVLGDTLLVCDQGQFAVIGVNLSTGRIRRWTELEHAPRCPVAAAVDDAGRMYVADTTWRAVLVYERDGSFDRQLAPTDAPDRAFRPAAVLVREGVLYVGNVGEHRIDRYDLTANRWLDPWTQADHGQSLFTPTGLASSDALLAVDTFGASVHRLQEDGTCTGDIGRLGRGTGEFVRPKSAAVSAEGLMFVVDAGRQSVQVFDQSGAHLAELNEAPGYWHGFTLPAGVVVFPADRAPRLLTRFAENGWPAPDEFVVVSDSLSGWPLVLFGITRAEPEGGHAG